MIIVGAGGHAKEILDLLTIAQLKNCTLYDDVSGGNHAYLNGIPICKNMLDAEFLIKQDPAFVLGTGNVTLRKKMAEMFRTAGGKLTTIISPLAFCSKMVTTIGAGTNIMSFAFVSNGVKMGDGCLINARVNLHHDVVMGDYCEISPAAVLLGKVQLGNFVSIGSGAIILPGITIGNNTVVGAGAIVTKNVDAGMTVVGNPAKEI